MVRFQLPLTWHSRLIITSFLYSIPYLLDAWLSFTLRPRQRSLWPILELTSYPGPENIILLIPRYIGLRIIPGAGADLSGRGSRCYQADVGVLWRTSAQSHRQVMGLVVAQIFTLLLIMLDRDMHLNLTDQGHVCIVPRLSQLLMSQDAWIWESHQAIGHHDRKSPTYDSSR